MRYWRGTETKEGQYGTMEDDGIVPDSVATTQAEYVAAQPKATPGNSDMDKLVAYAKLQGWIL